MQEANTQQELVLAATTQHSSAMQQDSNAMKQHAILEEFLYEKQRALLKLEYRLVEVSRNLTTVAAERVTIFKSMY